MRLLHEMVATAAAAASSSTALAPAPAQSLAAEATSTAALWQSPVPYLFGGLGAMLGIIALALLVLACSYWRLSDYVTGVASSSSSRNTQPADGKESAPDAAGPAPDQYREHVVVIMAGEARPTFLATPVIIPRAAAQSSPPEAAPAPPATSEPAAATTGSPA